MATRNPAQNIDVNTPLAADQFLEYRLKPQVNGNFALVDRAGTVVIAHTDFPPMSDECVWQLKATNNQGMILIKVPQSTYSTNGNVGDILTFVLSLGFFTAPGYVLTVNLCNAAGVIEKVKTATYTGGQTTDDPALETVNVVLS